MLFHYKRSLIFLYIMEVGARVSPSTLHYYAETWWWRGFGGAEEVEGKHDLDLEE